jgi:hypothetical protein
MRLIIIIAILFSWQIKAQEVNDFEVLRSSGQVPEEFNVLSSVKVKAEIQDVDKDQKRSDKKSEKRFILKSNYFIDQLLTNGGILYNEDLSQYVSKVADILLKNDKDLRDSLRFYIVKSSSVNAFATDRGSIFITVGLLAQIENEAQLAFVLAHEIIHFKMKHALTGFVENDRIEQGRGEYKRVKWEKTLNKSKYSKELEMEADVFGLEIFLDSKYSIEEISGTFDVLEFAHLPIDDIPLDSAFFNDSCLNVTKNYVKEEIDPIISSDNENDSYHSHPNINKRRAVMDFELEDETNEGRSKFIYSKKEFKKIQKLARFELSFLFIKQRLYGEAIYNSYVLLNSYPNDKYLKTTIGYSLYALSKYKNDNKLSRVLTDYDEVQGNSQQVFYLFDEMDDRMLGTLAVKYLWELKKLYNEDEFIGALANDALKELLLETGTRKTDFRKRFSKKDSARKGSKDSLKVKKSKYDKINKNSEGEDELKYAFVNLFKDEAFVDALNKYEKLYVEKAKGEEEEEEETVSDTKKERVGRALGIDNVVMVSPNYRRFDLRKKETERYKFAESRKQDFIDLNNKCANKRGIGLSLISNTYFNSTEQYNDMSLLNDWMDERFEHENVKILPFGKIFTNELITKYGTKYFGWTGMYSMRARKDKWGVIALSTLLYGAGVIWGIGYALTPEEHTFYYTYLVDITNYDFLMAKEDYVKMKGNNDVMKSYIYDSYHQIKTTKK